MNAPAATPAPAQPARPALSRPAFFAPLDLAADFGLALAFAADLDLDLDLDLSLIVKVVLVFVRVVALDFEAFVHEMSEEKRRRAVLYGNEMDVRGKR